MLTSKHILLALVEDKPGVLNRMASVFRRRGFNIQSVNVLETIETEDAGRPGLTRVAIVVAGSASILGQVRQQLEKIVDVVRVSDITARDIE
ncbi:MAG: acetolactate synthase small subunit [Dehalococcoidales bacterium]|jgi:acetolactate synthase-1/3 small subunit|nr:acetolactate synthase small subunit [Dehalococcoidales bacterium]MDP6577295.1 acetolactate synthase small subunit [Dehalococcoidales bacterium]MDP6825356.1 acetolactate synthase small subunit [Dehalococcoidales bacterium]|tara:strand:+ start:350 stop:625 length:276 start_codon:yes stop_codon:yes gene_type:complete